jgi:secondary thiamine-phosphate synthase enzyme
MKTYFEKSIRTNNNQEFLDITPAVQQAVQDSGVQDGLVTVFIPHTTAAVTINENADPAVKRDILYKIDDLIPVRDNYKHMEGNSAAHIKASLFGFSETVLIAAGSLQLGTWQDIYFCEFDGPRTRKFFIKILAG